MTQENLHTPNCIRTFTGKYVDIFNPDPDTLCIEDIAHHLSMQPRFAGALPFHYSVARHSINGANLLLYPKDRFAFLMHDSSEAYLIDFPKPQKDHPKFSFYKELEDNLMKVLSNKFGFEYPLSDNVKQMDRIMLNEEWDKIMLCNNINTEMMFEDVYSIKQVKEMFLKEFYCKRNVLQKVSI